MATKKPSKPLIKMCKLISRVGKVLKRSEQAHPVIKVACCMDDAPVKTALPSLPTAPVSAPIPVQKQLLAIPHITVPDNHGDGESPVPSPRAASFPPTPDHIKFNSNWDWEEENSFFPATREEVVEVRDWAIDFADLDVGMKMCKNSTGEIYRGRWHGNVLIYKHQDSSAVEQFMSDVENFSKIRHENVLLFMAASVDNANELAIVMQPPKHGESLHRLLASPRRLNKLPHTLKWSIAHQIAQTISYLHAKDILVGPALHSGNIFLESKIKLSLVDFGFGSDMFSRDASQNYLASYLAPELATLEGHPSSMNIPELKSHWTEACDSFAFGSLLYEVFMEEKPFANLTPAQLIESLHSGAAMKMVERVEIPPTIQKIISQCWHAVPAKRPTFVEIVQLASKRKVFMLGRHSSSQPDNLDMLSVSHSKSFG
ncbi:uncharacterized protein LOC129587537 [Paramacrobiotus metropolitanus]|uniref:uncharacterized protein LOC129587537 n=1 Tax=Paramacrobiotus metropolitanus TaxID=2943436 RepID=UPI002445C5E4|nr:uncharacterized protein LOC129587537 [Paramacrobiotus metropolitanus]